MKKLKKVTGPGSLMLSARKVVKADVEVVNACIAAYNEAVDWGSSEMQRVLRELVIRVASILEVGGLEDK